MNELSGGGGRGVKVNIMYPLFKGRVRIWSMIIEACLGVFGIYMYLYGILLILRDMG